MFYLFGVLGFIWGTWWFIGYMRDTSTDARELPEEKEAREKKEKEGSKAAPIPWGAFFRNKSFWALMAAHFTWNYFSYGLLAWLLLPLLRAERDAHEVLVPVHPALPRDRRRDHPGRSRRG